MPQLPSALLVASASLLSAAGVVGQPLRGSVAGARAHEEAARSVLIVRADEPLYQRPDPQARRRGTAALDARLPLYAAVTAPGCQGSWLMVGALAWVCQDVVQLDGAPPLPAVRPAPLPGGLPFHYYFVGPGGALAYTRLASAGFVEPAQELQPGFAVGLVRQARQASGDVFGLTTHGLWLALHELSPASPSGFHGERLGAGAPRLGWVLTDAAKVYSAPGKLLPEETRTRYERVEVLEERRLARREWLRVGEDRWLRRDDVAVSSAAPRPEGLRPGERWIDVDLAAQILTAWEGEEPVFATLVATGKGPRGSERRTPPGEHRIWIKLRQQDMDNLESETANSYYAMQAVPWVQFFLRGYGLHGTYWHRAFGAVRSHGCVNLSPLDAQALFEWTSPRLPAGWTAVFPTEYERGTLVRVREGSLQ